MIEIVLVILILLFVLGYVDIPSLPLHDTSLFSLFGHVVSLYDLLVFLIILWVIELLPWPFRGIASALLVLWLLSFFGIIIVTGFSNIVVLAVIVGIIAYLIRGVKTS